MLHRFPDAILPGIPRKGHPPSAACRRAGPWDAGHPAGEDRRAGMGGGMMLVGQGPSGFVTIDVPS